MGALDSPAAMEVLHEVQCALRDAPHGGKGAIVTAAAERLGVSVQAIYQALRKQWGRSLTVRKGQVVPPRKRRKDAGSFTLSQAEARAIAAYLLGSERGTGKVLADLQAAVETLRANGEILAGRVDEATGEFRALSLSQVSRALRHYNCHPGQLRQPAPKVTLSSPHPNYCWEIDPSLCVLYYLRTEDGLRCMPQDEFYKNKPKNLAKVEHERVWRYVFTDHTTGAFYVEYVLGAESGQNLCDTFINAIQRRDLEDPFCGVPQIAMLDPGSANTGEMFRSLCAALGCTVWINKPKQPWVKGAVEKTNDIVEREFEHRLRMHRVSSLAELNEAAWRWSRAFQSRVVHTRHRMTRFEAFSRITREQLRLAPSPQVCRTLARHAPESRVVNVYLRVSYRGVRYDVSKVPGVSVGEKLMVSPNAWVEGAVHILGQTDDGRAAYFVAPRVDRDEWKFEGGVPMGQYRALPETPADRERAAVERVAMGAATDEEAAAKRKAGELLFGGRVDPYKAIDEAPATPFIPRAGTPIDVQAPEVVEPAPSPPSIVRPVYEPRVLGHVEMARELRHRIEQRGGTWDPGYWPRMAALWPTGVTEEQLDACAVQLLRGGLQVVGGGA